jgi:predicted nucleic acid-binding protein
VRRYLLDTTPLTSYFLGRPAAVQRFRPWIAGHEAGTSALVYAEVVENLQSLPDFARRARELRRLLREVYPYALTYGALERYADLRREMRAGRRRLIGDVDTLIAATALERDLTVVTSDTDVERVPGLKRIVIPRDQLRRS